MKRFLIAIFLLAFVAAPVSAKKQIRYAVAVYHYNLQYVAGDTTIENRIIEQGFDPVLDFFLKHPTWGGDFEMQGYFLDALAERYPKILDKLRTLANSGQIEIVSFHYSDQLFLAYPRHDMEWSARINDETFKRHNVKKSPVVFTQEGQFGVGMADLMPLHSQNILILPKNLYRYFHGEQPAAPYYTIGGVSVLLGSRGVQYDDANVSLTLDWTYLDDAELLPTNRATPYSDQYHYHPDAMAKYEKELTDLEKAGYRIGNISDYVKAAREAGVHSGTLLDSPDGTWQPIDTDNVFRWMGDHVGQHERDLLVLTGNVQSRNMLLAAETAVAFLKKSGKDTSALDTRIFDAWRDQSLAEVSDSTGWTPMPVEIRYSRDMSNKVLKESRAILDEVKSALGAKLLEIDTASGTVKSIAELPKDAVLPQVPCPFEIGVAGELKASSLTCFQEAENIWRLQVHLETKNWYSNNLRLNFPLWARDIIYSPALLDTTVVRVPLKNLLTEKNDIYIPAANGLLGLGKDFYIIQKTDTVRLAYRITIEPRTAGIDMRKPPNSTYDWTLFIVRGTDADALKVANRWNVTPMVRY